MATAEQTVSAVLDATNKRYLVEHQEYSLDEGKAWFDRYSDGYVVQSGIVNEYADNEVVTLMVEMLDNNYYCTCKRIGRAGGANDWISSVSDLQTTQFTANPQGGSGYTWRVEGYAATN